MGSSNQEVDEVAYPLRLFMGGQHVEVTLRQSEQDQRSRRWFNALHAFAAAHHMRTEESDGIIMVRGAERGVRLPSGAIGAASVIPGMGRKLIVWIGAHEAVHRVRFWRCPELRGYRIVVAGENRHG